MALRLALRRLLATPGFTLGVIVVLALGSGATLTVFTVLNALVWKQLPVTEPDRLVALELQNAVGQPAAFPMPLFAELMRRQRVFKMFAGQLGASVVSAAADGKVHQAVVDGVTADYFRLLGVATTEGRNIGPGDYLADGAEADSVCVIMERYRQRMYGAGTDVMGRTITLGETTVTIVGVLSEGFSGIDVGVRSDIVVPAQIVGRIIGLRPGSVPMRHVIARLATGRSLDQARAELTAIWPSMLATTGPDQRSSNISERRLVVSSGATGVSTWRARYGGPLQVTMLASVWLLVIACTNLTGLQFTRALRRSRDVALSRALGASRWDVLGPTALESLLLCIVGLLTGVPLATRGAHLVTDLLSTGAVPLELDLAPDWGTWVAVAVLFVLVTVLAGLTPAWLAHRRAPGLSSGSRVLSGGGRVGSVLVVGQIALAVALLTGAALAVTALLAISRRHPGFDQHDVVAAQLMNRPAGYSDLDDALYYRTLIERLGSLPGVSAVALAKPLPGLSSSTVAQPVTAREISATSDAAIVVVSPGYFSALGLPLLSGRPFNWQDAEGAPGVALISRSLARDLSPGRFVAGLHIDVGLIPYHRGLEVIGIVDDASVLNVRDVAPRVVYLSALQQPPPMARWPGLLVRVQPGAAPVAAAMSSIVDDLGHEFVARTTSLAAQVTRSLARERLLAMMAIVYGSLAISMVAIGLWALLAHDVMRRVREFGVRLSLGASPWLLWRAVTARAIGLAMIGSAIGTLGTWMLSGALSAALDSTWTASPWTVGGVIALLITIAGVAAAGPAGQAARTEPMAALRSE